MIDLHHLVHSKPEMQYYSIAQQAKHRSQGAVLDAHGGLTILNHTRISEIYASEVTMVPVNESVGVDVIRTCVLRNFALIQSSREKFFNTEGSARPGETSYNLAT